MSNLSRRGFISGLASLITAPAIVRVSSIMPVKALPTEEFCYQYLYQSISLGYEITREAIIDNMLYGRYTDASSGLSELFAKELVA